MENISNINNNLKKIDYKHELLKNYVSELKDENFKNTVARLDIPEKIAMKYTTKIKRTACELKNCSNCKNILECKNEMPGCVYYPTKEDDRLRFDYVACKYKKEQLIREKNSSQVFNEPIEIKNASFDLIDKKDKTRAHVIKWIGNFFKEYQKDKTIKGCYLHGSFGAGKSYILAALLNELALKGNKTVIVYYPEMLRTLKESFQDDFKDIMNNLKNADILLLDDIGAESVSEWSRDEILGTILQYRMDSKKTTFFTSNLTIDELETHLSNTKQGVNIVKAKRIIERIKQLTTDIELISENRRV